MFPGRLSGLQSEAWSGKRICQGVSPPSPKERVNCLVFTIYFSPWTPRAALHVDQSELKEEKRRRWDTALRDRVLVWIKIHKYLESFIFRDSQKNLWCSKGQLLCAIFFFYFPVPFFSDFYGNPTAPRLKNSSRLTVPPVLQGLISLFPPPEQCCSLCCVAAIGPTSLLTCVAHPETDTWAHLRELKKKQKDENNTLKLQALILSTEMNCLCYFHQKCDFNETQTSETKTNNRRGASRGPNVCLRRVNYPTKMEPHLCLPTQQKHRTAFSPLTSILCAAITYLCVNAVI